MIKKNTNDEDDDKILFRMNDKMRKKKLQEKIE